jgi:hypothetical protein
MTPVTIGVAIAGVAASGAYLRWAITPVSIAYRIGRAIGRRAW